MARAPSASRHIPLRRCASCRRSRTQAELLRFYREKVGGTHGAWRFDAARRAGGRGTWLCADTPSCWELKKLRRTFRAQADQIHALLQTLPQIESQTEQQNPVGTPQPPTPDAAHSTAQTAAHKTAHSTEVSPQPPTTMN